MILIIKGSPTEAALALSAHNIAVQTDFEHIVRFNWTKVQVHSVYAHDVRKWFNERHHPLARPGSLLSFNETEFSGLLV
ncbi:MAG: hypothetical protein ACREBW_01985 [Candidatus Micrarchaeaceae archaeon]